MAKSHKKVKLNKKKFIRFLILCAVLIFAVLFFFTPLFLKLNGDKEISLGLGEEYEEEGATAFFGLGKVKIKGEVDTSTIGKYKIKYSFLTESVKRTVLVEDKTSPVITLNGRSSMSIQTGGSYSEEGCSATDDVDGDVSSSVTISIKYTDPISGLETEVSSVDCSKEGTYEISYVAEDKSGNKAREKRTVTVSETGPDTAGLLEFTDMFNEYYADVICKEVGTDEAKFEGLTLFGDSFIEKLGEIGLVSYSQLWSRPSLSTDDFYTKAIYYYCQFDEKTTFFDAMDTYSPENILILINSDWTLNWTPDYLYKSCDEAYATIKEKYPDTNVIICSIMPVDIWYERDEYVAEVGFSRNDKINKMNVKMAELCRKYGFKFMNAAEAVKNPETGACYDEYIYAADGIHLSDEGCQVMLDYIKSHLDY